MSFEDRKPKIDYPCEWQYKIIGNSVEGIIYAIEEAADGLEYDITPSNISKTGKYFSLNLKVKVENEFIRNSVYASLDSFDSILMVF